MSLESRSHDSTTLTHRTRIPLARFTQYLPPPRKHGLETSNEVTFPKSSQTIAEEIKWESEAVGIRQIPTWKRYWRWAWKPFTGFLWFCAIFVWRKQRQFLFKLSLQWITVEVLENMFWHLATSINRVRLLSPVRLLQAWFIRKTRVVNSVREKIGLDLPIKSIRLRLAWQRDLVRHAKIPRLLAPQITLSFFSFLLHSKYPLRLDSNVKHLPR